MKMQILDRNHWKFFKLIYSKNLIKKFIKIYIYWLLYFMKMKLLSRNFHLQIKIEKIKYDLIK